MRIPKKSPLQQVISADDIPEFFHTSPEHVLWISVTERAVLDYVRYFDWWTFTADRPTHFATLEERRHSVKARMKSELAVLEWFFFERESTPCNLSWIFDHVFNGDQALLEKIRRTIREKHLSNLVEHRDHPAVAAFIAQLEADGVAVDETPQHPRQKKIPSRVILLH